MMTDPVITEQQPSNPDQNLSSEFDSLPVPPLDPLFFSDNGEINSIHEPFISDLGLDVDDVDFDFSFDDLYFPSETEDLLAGDFFCDEFLQDAPNDVVLQVHADGNSDSPVSSQISVDGKPDVVRDLDSSSHQSGNCDRGSGDRDSRTVRVLNSNSVESGEGDRGFSRRQDSGDGSSSNGGVLNSPSPECGSSNREFSGPTSSQGSGNFESGFEARNLPSPDGNCEKDVSSNFIIDEKIKLEEMGKACISKRKKGHEDYNTESRGSKFRKSSMDSGLDAENEVEGKRKARLMRNRESAQLSRQRKKHYVEELEDKVRTMHSTIQDLNSKISYFMAENATLRQQLTGGMCPPPPPGMYPHTPMAPVPYPWLPAPYIVKPQGSQVPLVPIPRLKPQQPVSISKPKKSDKENKKAEVKTKKVASVSFLGLLFFIFLFGGLVPLVNVKYGGIGDNIPNGLNHVGSGFHAQREGRVFTVNGSSNQSDHFMGVEKFDFANKVRSRSGEVGIENKKKGSQKIPGSDRRANSGNSGNSSEPLVASLYVPRNDKLVKIDGNLIIHSVLASEKALAYQASGRKSNEETGLAIAGNLGPALAFSEVGRSKGRNSRLYRNPTERQRALTSGSADSFTENTRSADGKLQQWFREGLAGPMLSSGMCTEVFHFDVSPASAPGAIVPASSVTNRSREQRNNSTRLYKGKNRRFLRGLPVRFNGTALNITEERDVRNSPKDNFEGNKSLSSMVVSVLVDPREVGDGDGDGIIGPKSLSRIFVVVLLDSVKYVTYSCMLPLKGSGAHLVTT